MLIEVEDDGVGKYVAMGNPMKMDMTPPVIEKGAPGMGIDTKKVLAEFGYSEEEIEAFAKAEVI